MNETNLKMAITGTIGAGKSFVCERLRQRGVVVYDCDAAAKRIMRESEELREQLCELIGSDAYVDGRVNKAVVARFLLQSESNKQLLNGIIHPAVAFDFEKSGLNWLESAILFESRFDKLVSFDHVVCVTAPKEMRINRIMNRDGITHGMAEEWIDKQMPQEEIVSKSDFILVNDGKTDVDSQIEKMLVQWNLFN